MAHRKAVKINLSGLYQALENNSVIFFYDKLNLKSIDFKNTFDQLAYSGDAKYGYHCVYIDVNKYLNGIMSSGVGESALGQPISDVFFDDRAPVLILVKRNGESGFVMRHLQLSALRSDVKKFFKFR
jgi:hypothetical protein